MTSHWRKMWGVVALTLTAAGCGGAPEEAFEEELLPASSSEALEEEPSAPTSERPDIEEDPFEPEPMPAPGPAPAVVVFDPRRSLAVTDRSILSGFTIDRVMNQLAAQNGTTGLNSSQLFRQLWDTQNPGPGLALGAHCNDPAPTDMTVAAFNKFPYACRSGDGSQASITTLTGTNYVAVGLFNRFDLANSNGARCGEYRIVFSRGDSSFIIFEASLPNPRTDLGIEGCRPVANFWNNLSGQPDPLQRKALLESFYFTGLTGFQPVVHMSNFGHNSLKAGQVRTNTFLSSPWMLREFKLVRSCPSTGCTLRFDPVTNKVNPFGPLFNEGSTHPLAAEFQAHFVTQVPTLARNDINTFTYSVPDRFNSGQSLSVPSSETDYVTQFNAGGTTVDTNLFRKQIQDKLTAMGSTLSPNEIVARAQALSCAGCHHISAGDSLGSTLVWPNPLGNFFHTSQQSDPADASRFRISDALTNVFLPRRQSLLQSYLKTPVKSSTFVSQVVPTSVAAGQSFTVKVTMKNAGNTTWRESTGFRLATLANHWGVTRVPLASTESIIKAGQKAFTFTVTAPTLPGTYTFKWQMVQDVTGGGVFGAITPAVSIVVK